MYTLTLKAIQSLAEIRFRVITAGLAFYAFARSVNNKQRMIMKTHVIKDDGTVTVVEGKIEDLDAMQKLVKGPIEIVNAAMPAASQELPGSQALKEMIVNEEGLFNSSFQTNHKARKLIAQGLGVQLDNIQDIRGDVFVTDGWRIA
jgi:hypothetical protein